MDFMRGLVSATLLIAWIGGAVLFGQNPTTGWAIFLMCLVSLAVIIWWQWLPGDPEVERRRAQDGRGAPPVRKRKNRFLKP